MQRKLVIALTVITTGYGCSVTTPSERAATDAGFGARECDAQTCDAGQYRNDDADARTVTATSDAEAPTACSAFCANYESCDLQSWKTIVGDCTSFKGHTCGCSDICEVTSTQCVACLGSAPTCAEAKSQCEVACGI